MALKIIFMGTPLFALPTLKALLGEGYEIVGVYTQAPKPAGRGYGIQKSPIHEFAESCDLPVFTPKSLRNLEEQEKFANLQADLGVVVAYGLILPKAILDAPQFGCLNIHGSLLPRWRGAAPMQRSLLAGDAQTGVTIMQMDEGLDTGPMLTIEAIPLSKTTTISDLHDHMSDVGAQLLLKTIPDFITGHIKPITQPQEGVTYADKLSKADGLVDWRQSALVLERKVRALTPWPGVHFFDGPTQLKILQAEVIDQEGRPGEILDNQLTIACGQQALRILKIQKPGSKPMDALAFLNGYPLKVGMILPCLATN